MDGGDKLPPHDSCKARVLVIVNSFDFQLERNGATLNPKASTPYFALDTAVVVIDGTKGSEVQILSPRPFIFRDLQPSGENQSRPTWSWPRCSSFRMRINVALRAYQGCTTISKSDYSTRSRTRPSSVIFSNLKHLPRRFTR